MILGANMIPRRTRQKEDGLGIQKTQERCDRPAKYQWLEHAERLCVLRCALEGLSTQGAKMYGPWNPCVDCARSIICAGVSEYYGLKAISENLPEHWKESCKVAEQMMTEAGVKV